MRNVKATVKGDILTITVNLKEPRWLSTSGKSHNIASTEGNVSVEGCPEIKLGLNCYTAVPKAPPA
jgi:hypothetical protein